MGKVFEGERQIIKARIDMIYNSRGVRFESPTLIVILKRNNMKLRACIWLSKCDNAFENI